MILYTKECEDVKEVPDFFRFFQKSTCKPLRTGYNKFRKGGIVHKKGCDAGQYMWISNYISKFPSFKISIRLSTIQQDEIPHFYEKQTGQVPSFRIQTFAIR